MLSNFKEPNGKSMERKETERLSAELLESRRKNNPPSKPVMLPAREKRHSNAKRTEETAGTEKT